MNIKAYRFQYHKTRQAPADATIGVTISQTKAPDICTECQATIPPGTEYLLPKYFDPTHTNYHDPVVCMPCAVKVGWVEYVEK